MHLADATFFYPKRLKIRLYIFFCQYVCSLGIEPTTFCAANAMLYHWVTGTPKYSCKQQLRGQEDNRGTVRSYAWHGATDQSHKLRFKKNGLQPINKYLLVIAYHSWASGVSVGWQWHTRFAVNMPKLCKTTASDIFWHQILNYKRLVWSININNVYPAWSEDNPS